MTATIWTSPGCGACEMEKAILQANGYSIAEIVVDDPGLMDHEAFLQLHNQNGMFPVVRIGSRFHTPAFISKAMEW